MMDNPMSENLASAILFAAIKEGRSSELLYCLMKGGSCTVDAATRKLVLVTADQLAEMIKDY